MPVIISNCLRLGDVHQLLIEQLGIYNLWDDMVFIEQTAEDLMWFFKVNVVVSCGCSFRRRVIGKPLFS